MTEDSRNWKRYTRRGALGLMGVGAVGVASETLGFTNLTADRQASVNVDTDLNSTLVIAAQVSGSDEELGDDNVQPFNPILDVEIRNDGGPDPISLTGISSTNSIENDFSPTVDLSPSGTTTVTFENTTASQRGSNITIDAESDATLTISRDNVTFDAANVDSISLSANPSSLSNGGGETSDITATVTNSNNMPLEGFTVNFTISSGNGSLSTSSGTTDSNGEATTTYTTDAADDDSTVTIQGEADGQTNTVDITVGSP